MTVRAELWKSLAIGLAAILSSAVPAHGETTSPDFRFDVRPILSKNCFSCHGPDEAHREADLRLDQLEAAIEIGAIIPGAPNESEMIRRITSDDPNERMPPAKTGRNLTDAEIGTNSSVDCQRSEVFKTLVVRGAAKIAVAKSFAARMVSQRDRLFRTRATGSGRI